MLSSDDSNHKSRREILKIAAAGSALILLGQYKYCIASDEEIANVRDQIRPDGKLRLPPGQKLIKQLKPMGGERGSPNIKHFNLKIHGEVNKPMELNYHELIHLPKVQQICDVHCVTGWSVFDSQWIGVRLSTLLKKVNPKRSARYVIFEAAHGYTSIIPMKEALKPNVLIAYKFHEKSLPYRHGGPVRSVVPDRYFWKSAKWLTGIRLSRRRHTGYWEQRGYNHADPWAVKEVYEDFKL